MFGLKGRQDAFRLLLPKEFIMPEVEEKYSEIQPIDIRRKISRIAPNRRKTFSIKRNKAQLNRINYLQNHKQCDILSKVVNMLICLL